jgi:hypothetical protein
VLLSRQLQRKCPLAAIGLSSVLSVLLLLGACGRAHDLGYDPFADPFQQLEDATIRARADGKHILIVAGGDWCRSCHVLDDFLKENTDVTQLLDETFVLVKVYIGQEAPERPFFSRLPEVVAVPHFWVLSTDGTPLASLNVGGMETMR